MKASVILGRPFGVTIGAHWSLFAFAALAMWTIAEGFATALPGYASGTYWVTAGLVVMLFVGGLIIHELAHALVARRYGIEVDSITLWILGGLAHLTSEPRTARAEIRIAAAGPVASVAVSAMLAGAAVLADALTDARVLIAGLSWLAVLNAVLAVFNLLPARPLDGGRILTGILWAIRKDRTRATIAAANVSVVMGWVLVGLGALAVVGGAFGGVWLALIGWMVVAGSRAELRLQSWRVALQGLRFRDVMSAPPPSVPAWTPLRELAHSTASPIYLVDDGHGGVRGTVVMAVVSRLALARPDLLVGEVARPLNQNAVAGPDEDVAATLGARPVLLPVLVREGDGPVLGQVLASDLARWTAPRRHGTPPRPPAATSGSWAPPRPMDRVG